MSRPFVVVGANLAGGRAVEALRGEGFDGEVVLVGQEPDRPYERPPLSKEVLRKEADAESVFLREPGWYDDHDIDLRLGVRATELEGDRLRLSDGRWVPFEACLLATGGRPRRLEVPGADLEGVSYLRTLRDASALAEALEHRPRVVVVGAGFIGAEVAASARMVGCEVTVLEMLEVPLARVLGPRIGEVYADLHRDQGVDLRLGEGVEGFEGAGCVETVLASSGERYEADLVVVGVGIVPNVELAESAGIACDNGVVVDEQCRTSVPGIYAAGDVARRPDAHSGTAIRVEHFQNAQNQGAAAARSMLGSHDPFQEVPWFWSDAYDTNLQMLGHPPEGSEPVIRGSLAEREFTAVYVREDRVVAAVTFDRPGDVGALRRLIERRVEVGAETLADPDTELRDLLRR